MRPPGETAHSETLGTQEDTVEVGRVTQATLLISACRETPPKLRQAVRLRSNSLHVGVVLRDTGEWLKPPGGSLQGGV